MVTKIVSSRIWCQPLENRAPQFRHPSRWMRSFARPISLVIMGVPVLTKYLGLEMDSPAEVPQEFVDPPGRINDQCQQKLKYGLCFCHRFFLIRKVIRLGVR